LNAKFCIARKQRPSPIAIGLSPSDPLGSPRRAPSIISVALDSTDEIQVAAHHIRSVFWNTPTQSY
jgi:hypothetical protein